MTTQLLTKVMALKGLPPIPEPIVEDGAAPSYLRRWRQEPIEVVWKEAPDLPAQEQALQEFAGVHAVSGIHAIYRDDQVRDFIAQEYERLASIPSADHDARQRFLERAKEFRHSGQQQSAKGNE